MGQLKPWQIVLFVAAIGVLGVSLWFSLKTDRERPADHVVFVDVTTGELVRARITRSMFMPEVRPDGAAVLWPVFRDEDSGEWLINPRHLPRVSEQTDGQINTEYVDLTTGRVRPANSSPKRMSLSSRS